MTAQPPSGTVTFLLTDLEGSTRMWEQDPEAMKAAMVRHDEILEKSIAAHRGYLFSRMGDGMAAAFATAGEAVAAAASFRHRLAGEHWGTTNPLRARVGLHTDEGIVVDGNNYVSQPVNRAARLMAAAHGGQIVVSGSTESLVRDELPGEMQLTDLGEHRLRDLGSTMRIFQLVETDGCDEFPPLRSLDSFPGNLPTQASSFIGRQAEVAEIASALSESRVVTITGVGGVGKTRLALQVAADLLPRYRDGVWFVELAPIRDPDDVTQAVASMFKLSNRSGRSLEDSLVEMLAYKDVLLVLDNCEHLLGPTASLVTRIERECPDVAVLATSREGMAVDGEQLMALPPLQAGESGDNITHLMHTDAVTLFVERARRVRANFALTENNSHAVVEVCQRLDGVPLAIELAAARVIALSPAELARRLDRRFMLLAGGRRGAVERHATLRAAIDWSYELLSPAEQRLLARMAAFSGGCSLDAIEVICGSDPVEPEAVIDLVASLVARSLVIADDHDSGTRYRLLETIRQYGEERLGDLEETETLFNRHACFYANLLTRLAERSYGPEQLDCAKAAHLERDNIRAALAYAIDTGNAQLAVRLVADHPDLKSHAGSPTGEVLLMPTSRIIELAGVREATGCPDVLIVAAQQSLVIGRDRAAADEFCRQAVDVEMSLGAARTGWRAETHVWVLRAEAATWSGDYPEGVASYTHAAELAAAGGFPGLAAMFLAYGVNVALLGGGDAKDVLPEAEEAVVLARRSGMPGAIVQSLNSLALTLAERDPPRAKALLRESLELVGTPGEHFSTTILTASMVAGRLKEWELTLALAGRSMYLDRWTNGAAQVATSLAECARAFAEDKPEVSGVLQGASYAAFGRADTASGAIRRMERSASDHSGNFVLGALREAGEITVATLGSERAQELRIKGAQMVVDEAVSYALANIDPKLLRGPIVTT